MYTSIKDRIESAKKQKIENKKSQIRNLCCQKGIDVPCDLDSYSEDELDSLISRLRSCNKEEIERYIR